MKRFFRNITVYSLAATVTFSSHSMTMQQLFDNINAQGNVSNPAILQGQTMNMYTGGSMFMRMPRRTYQLANMTAPSWNAGCGGIDLFMGGFGFINKEQFVAMLRNIGSNALGYGFKLAIQNLCPTCDNVMQALQATAQGINRMNIDSCEAAKGIVNASVPDSWNRGRQDAAKSFGVDGNFFENITDAWSNVMSNESRANTTLAQSSNASPEAKDKIPTGNIVWKAVSKLDGINNEHKMILMSLIGTVIFKPDGEKSAPVFLEPQDISIPTLVGNNTASQTISVPIWQCDTYSADGCLNPSISQISSKSFRSMVAEKMSAISNNIAARQQHGSVDQVMAFLNVTDLPVYKMLAVSTSLDNTALAESLISRYQDLIAAKFADVYIRRGVKDLRDAMSRFSAVADASQTEVLEKIKPRLDSVSRDANDVIKIAYAQTISTYNIAQEVQFMERSVNSNLSQSLRASLAFGKSIR